MEEDPSSEEELTAALVDPPDGELLSKRKRLLRCLVRRGGGIRTLKSLESSSLRFVAFEVRRLRAGGGGIKSKVGVVFQVAA